MHICCLFINICVTFYMIATLSNLEMDRAYQKLSESQRWSSYERNCANRENIEVTLSSGTRHLTESRKPCACVEGVTYV